MATTPINATERTATTSEGLTIMLRLFRRTASLPPSTVSFLITVLYHTKNKKNHPSPLSTSYAFSINPVIIPKREGNAQSGKLLTASRAVERACLEMLAAQRDDAGSEVIGFLQVFLFVGLDHQLVHYHHVPIRQRLCGLETELHHRASFFVNLHQAARAGDAVNAMLDGGAIHLQVAELDQLLVLALSEHLAQQDLRATLSREMFAH